MFQQQPLFLQTKLELTAMAFLSAQIFCECFQETTQMFCDRKEELYVAVDVAVFTEWVCSKQMVAAFMYIDFTFHFCHGCLCDCDITQTALGLSTCIPTRYFFCTLLVYSPCNT